MDEVYKDAAFSLAWDNSVKHHVSRHLLHLRRYRGMSQKVVGAAMGTSQSAIARVEGGEENITLDTLERHINALDGRFEVSIKPKEFPVARRALWWRQSDAAHDWSVRGWAYRAVGKVEQAVVALQRDRDLSPGFVIQGGTTTLAGRILHGQAKS